MGGGGERVIGVSMHVCLYIHMHSCVLYVCMISIAVLACRLLATLLSIPENLMW